MTSVVESRALTLHASGDVVKVDNCISLTLYLGVQRPVLLHGDTRGIKLAPYNVLSLEDSDSYTGKEVEGTLDSFSTKWSTPVCCAAEEEYSFLNPKDFLPLVVPGQAPSELSCGLDDESLMPFRKALLALPEVYAGPLEQKLAELKPLQGGGLSTSLKKQIGDAFREWLKSSGKLKQLTDLARIQTAGLGGG